MKKFKLWDKAVIVFILILWQVVGMLEIVPAFMLPTPIEVLVALIGDWKLIGESCLITLYEAFTGMGAALLVSLVLAICMDRFKFVHEALFPICVVSQTIPTIAIAPLLVLWFGFGVTPKVLLVFLTCFFPLLVGLVSGFDSADKNVLRLYRSMGGGYFKTLFDVKFPYAMESFFAGLKVSASYSIVGAVIAEWLGGDGGLGVYMTRVRKSFQFDKMFAVIIVVSALSLLLMKFVEKLQNRVLKWKQ
ncbi:MAG: ABC transporter permease [Clostridia bacterium]|nr:ABC transporter permease [Clostridia bacterium]